MESNRTTNLALVSFASVILGISVSLFLSNLYLLEQVFPYIFEDCRVVAIFVESSLAYLIGFLLIVTQDRNLDMITRERIPNLLLIGGILVFMLLVGVKSSSLDYLNISSFTLIVLALTYHTISPKKFHFKTRDLVVVVCFFFIFAHFVIDPDCNTSLEDARVTGYKQSDDGIHLEIETVFCQKETNTRNVCFEMILPEGIIEKNSECIKIVDFLYENDKSLLDWHVVLPEKGEEYTLYLLVWNESEEKQCKIRIPPDVKKGDSLPKGKFTPIEYLKILFFKLRRVF